MNKPYCDLLKEHIDKYCGEEPDKFFKEGTTDISVAKFNNVPYDGLTTFLSIGLSGHIFIQESGLNIRQELLVTVDTRFSEVSVEDIIFSVIKEMLDTHKPLKLGQVIGSRGLLFEEEKEITLTSCLCSHPAFFPEDFSLFENINTTVFVELIFISTNEAEWIKENGWSGFFDLVNNQKIDVLNLHRS